MRHRGFYHCPAVVAILLSGLLLVCLAGSSCNQNSRHSKSNSKPVDIQKSITEAKENKQMILLKFEADWCGPCHVLSEKIMPQQEVQKVLENWMVINVDVDKYGNLANKHSISVIPSLVAMTPKEQVLIRLDGMVSAPQLVAFIQAAEEKAKRQTQPAGG